MIKGGFDKGRPTVLAEVSSRESANHMTVNFLIDTGALNTTIMPGDASKFQVDFSRLQSAPALHIGGGMIPCYYISIDIDLIDGGVVYTYIGIDARIVNPLQCSVTHPSILGQTAWVRWGLYISSTTVEIDPIKPDLRDPPLHP